MSKEGKKRTCKHCKKAVEARGLCHSHYAYFERIKSSVPKANRNAFDSMCVSQGLVDESLRPDPTPRTRKHTSPFRVIADKFLD